MASKRERYLRNLGASASGTSFEAKLDAIAMRRTPSGTHESKNAESPCWKRAFHTWSEPTAIASYPLQSAASRASRLLKLRVKLRCCLRKRRRCLITRWRFSRHSDCAITDSGFSRGVPCA